ncbi:MAG: type II toxin-antitoxin system RatA family toxin [Pseudomonadota bacterium]
MPTHTEKRRVPYAPDQVFDLVADVEAYPEFLPWTSGCRVRTRRPLTMEDIDAAAASTPRSGRAHRAAEVIEADLIVSFKVFRERFGSRVTLLPEERRIDVAYLDGPFRYLDNHWRFIENEDGTTTIDFFVDFEFKSRLLQRLIGAVFNEAMQRIVRAFERRADALYGDGGAAPQPA